MFKNQNQIVFLKKFFNSTPNLTKEELKNALDQVIKQVDVNIEYFDGNFQSPQTYWNKYQKMANIEWTDGFWTGIVWLAYEYTKDEKYKKLALKHVDSFYDRIDKRIEVDHHDMGFLFSLSCVAGYKLTKSEKGKQAGLLAAANLASRYRPQEEFIQAWNSTANNNNNNNYRLIIDCLINIPLLYWASENGIVDYTKIGIKHFNSSLKTVIREDGTTFHTYYYDKQTGKPLYGKTRQGYSDESCWARGQAWGIYGIGLTWKYHQNNLNLNPNTIKIYYKVVNQFLNNLGFDDQIAYWDLIFNDDINHVRDSSASAISVCGLLEMDKHLKNDNNQKIYTKAAHCILRSLINKYAVYELKPGAPLLYHGVYSWHTQRGVDEGNIWGDYFYFEALMRLWNPDWNPYW